MFSREAGEHDCKEIIQGGHHRMNVEEYLQQARLLDQRINFNLRRPAITT